MTIIEVIIMFLAFYFFFNIDWWSVYTFIF